MKTENIQMNDQPICIGAGLVALDVIISSHSESPTQFLAGGSCGNVMAILSFLGWDSYPIARLSNNVAAELLCEDLAKWDVNDDLLTFTSDGSTPIIIHRILKDRSGMPKHRFEFRNPEDGTYLPSYKPCLAKSVEEIVSKSKSPQVFYFDRINRSSIDLAKSYKYNGATIIFEPSSMKDEKGFKECIEVANIVKFSNDRIADYERLYPECNVELEIQTLGNYGLKFRCKGDQSWTSLTGYSIENLVDSAGAGDWCTAGLLWLLFRAKKEFDYTNREEIINALQFGQALSALNCMFEGARGLMYNITRTELLLYVQHIVASNSHSINKRKSQSKYEIKTLERKISSLFAPVNVIY